MGNANPRSPSEFLTPAAPANSRDTSIQSFMPAASSGMVNMTKDEFHGALSSAREEGGHQGYYPGATRGKDSERDWLRGLACQQCKDRLPVDDADEARQPEWWEL